eukprot:1482500-Amphidinium_carterae.1
MEIGSLESPSGGGLRVRLRLSSLSRKLLNEIADSIVPARVQELAADLCMVAVGIQLIPAGCHIALERRCRRTPNCKVALQMISAGCVGTLGRVCAQAAVATRKQSTGPCGCVKARMC